VAVERAVRALLLLLLMHGALTCSAIIGAQVVVTDLVRGLEARLGGRVDLLVFNPPYVPSPADEARCRVRAAGPARAPAA
jgi:methylase of polypeptide subunit release factors